MLFLMYKQIVLHVGRVYGSFNTGFIDFRHESHFFFIIRIQDLGKGQPPQSIILGVFGTHLPD